MINRIAWKCQNKKIMWVFKPFVNEKKILAQTKWTISEIDWQNIIILILLCILNMKSNVL